MPASKQTKASVIICVHNALADVKECLESVYANTTAPIELIIVDDGSDEPTRLYLAAFAEAHSTQLITHQKALGYTVSANEGLRLASSDLLVLLNSDTLVTRNWLESLLECSAVTPLTGIVGSLSNSAGWQSVPSLRRWITNTLPKGIALEEMAALVRASSRRRYPRVTIVNGFCLAIRRAVLERIGCLDEASFPVGYGEETDYCIRAAQAGFELRVADDCYIYHKKSRSFSFERRARLVEAGEQQLTRKHGTDYRDKYVASMNNNRELSIVRRRLRLNLFLRRLGLLRVNKTS